MTNLSNLANAIAYLRTTIVERFHVHLQKEGEVEIASAADFKDDSPFANFIELEYCKLWCNISAGGSFKKN